MILDRLENAARYEPLHTRFGRALGFLKEQRPDGMKPGRYELDGADLYAIVTKDQGKTPGQAKLEVHRRYIDIHFVVDGIEKIGWKAIDRCTVTDTPYSAEKDFQLFRDVPESWSVLAPGTFAVFFPEDAHAPMVAEGTVYKVVVKIAV